MGTESGDLGTTLVGGDGDDVVTGGGDDDRLEGGAGKDRLSGAAATTGSSATASRSRAGADAIDGGEGATPCSRAGARASWWISRTRRRRCAGEGDALTGVENVNGGSANDVLTGDDGPNRLVGGRVTTC